MKKLLVISLLFSLPGYSQQYTRTEIIHAADSVLKYYVKNDVFSHSRNELNTDAFVYYRYTDHKGRTKFHEVPRGRRLTKGRFKELEVWYKVKYPYPKCKVCDTVKGETSLVLGRKLEVIKAPDISFIPDYVWEQDSCRYTVRHYVPIKNGSQGRKR